MMEDTGLPLKRCVIGDRAVTLSVTADDRWVVVMDGWWPAQSFDRTYGGGGPLRLFDNAAEAVAFYDRCARQLAIDGAAKALGVE